MCIIHAVLCDNSAEVFPHPEKGVCLHFRGMREVELRARRVCSAKLGVGEDLSADHSPEFLQIHSHAQKLSSYNLFSLATQAFSGFAR